MDKKHIINYDFQGWPVAKLTLKEILISLGGKEQENGDILIPKIPAFEDCPVLYQDDGMGYGVDEEYITEISLNNNSTCSMFREKEVKNIDLWVKSRFYPGAFVIPKDPGTKVKNSWWLNDIRQLGDNEFEYFYGTIDKSEGFWIPEDKLEWE